MPDSIVDPYAGFKSNFLSGYPPFGDSIRKDKLKLGSPYVAPPHLYLLYLSATNDGTIIARHLEKDIIPANIDAEEDALIALAKQGSGTSYGFVLIKFTEPSYFTVVLDSDGWEFYYPDPGKEVPNPNSIHDPIVFLVEKSVIKEIPLGSGDWFTITRPFKENYAFYNSKSVDKNVAGQTRKAVRCINFLTKNAAGEPLGRGEKQNFGFNILVQVPVELSAEKVMLHVDPDGQNQGPP